MVTAAGEQLGIGDTIATRQNDSEIDVANRELRNVVDSSPAGLHVDGESGQRILPSAYVRVHVELAYATTAYGAQGSTVDTSHVLIGDHTGTASAYVEMTRGRERNVAHLVAGILDCSRPRALTRLTAGVLRPTKAAADEHEAVRRLRSWFSANEFSTMAAERAVALVAAHGPLQVAEIAADVHPLLGHGWSRGGQPITTRDVEDELRSLAHQLQALDLISRTRSVWSAGPSARSLLPGANLLADLL